MCALVNKYIYTVYINIYSKLEIFIAVELNTCIRFSFIFRFLNRAVFATLIFKQFDNLKNKIQIVPIKFGEFENFDFEEEPSSVSSSSNPSAKEECLKKIIEQHFDEEIAYKQLELNTIDEVKPL